MYQCLKMFFDWLLSASLPSHLRNGSIASLRLRQQLVEKGWCNEILQTTHRPIDHIQDHEILDIPDRVHNQIQ